MIKPEKKKLKRPLVITVTASVLLVLIVVTTVVLETLINGGFGTGETNTKPTPPELIEGEALYNSTTALMYPSTTSAKIQSFTVNGENGYFAAKRPNKDSGIFIYYYKDDEGTEQVYLPPICYSDSSFDYTTLYANSGDGMNTQKLTYVLSSISIPMFDSRIELKPDSNGHYGSALSVYGLDSEHRESITFTYLENDKEVTRTVYIGNRLVTGIGYYIQLSDRPEYVYVSSGSENYKYALEGFSSFVVPRLIMQGNSANGDTTAEPLLTTGYKQWKNVVYDGKDKWGNTKPTPDMVAEGSNIVFTADVLSSIYTSKEDSDLTHTDGYVHSGYKSYQVDLADSAKRAIFKRFIATVTGKAVGNYEDDNILATIVKNTNPVTIKDGVSKKYTYEIYEIESVLTDDSEYTSGPVGDNNLIKVNYTYLIDGKEYVGDGEVLPFGEPLHAVIDLSDERIPLNIRQYLRAQNVGRLSERQKFDIVYTEENANASKATYIIQDITLIHEIKDEELIAVDKITENSIVTFNYRLLSDGEVVDEGIETMPLGEITDKSEDFLKEVKKKLLGLEMQDGVDIKVYEQNEYYQIFMNFETYSIKSIDYYVVRELVSAYKFVNPSDRDSFYGEAIHENDLPENHPNKAYAVDWQSCDYVAKILGGITAGSSSTVFEGLWGSEVVDVGLTPANMKEYGLYDYTIYFELPRLLTMVGDDYEWFDTTGFTLYISSRNSDGTRYVGSDMYDIIVKMDADILYWVEESFIDFWARRDIVMVHQSKLDKVTATIDLDTFKGKYVFDVEHPDAWLTEDGLVFVDPGEDVTNKEKYNALNVFASVSGEYTETLLSQCMEKQGSQNVHLANIYNIAAGITSGEGLVEGYDTLGDSNFKSFLSVLYGTGYMGLLTPDEKSFISEKTPVMTLSFYLESSSESSVDEYAYDFYYTDLGRVAVSVYRYNAYTGERRGERCDFYISNFGFKKIVGSISNLLNGVVIDLDAGYKE